jgi:quinol monooxygenase YgiN
MTLSASDICNVDNLLLNEDYVTLCQLQKKMKRHKHKYTTKNNMYRYSGEPSFQTNIIEKPFHRNDLSCDTLYTNEQKTSYVNMSSKDELDEVKIESKENDVGSQCNQFDKSNGMVDAFDNKPMVKLIEREDVMIGHNIENNFDLSPPLSNDQMQAEEEEFLITLSQQGVLSDDLVSTINDAPSSNMTTKEMEKYLELGWQNFAAEWQNVKNTDFILKNEDPLLNEQVVGLDDLDRGKNVTIETDTYDEGKSEEMMTSNEMQHDLVRTDEENTKMDTDTGADEGNHERILVPNFAAVRFSVPSDGSCLYHALSFYVEKKGNRLRVVNPHEKRDAIKKPPSLNYKVSNFLKEWINHFIFDHIDLLSELFDKAILDEEHMCMDTNKLKAKLKKEALEAMAPASPAWGGSLQIHTFALLTKTNVCVWTERDGHMYEKMIESQKTLAHLNQEHMKPYMKKIENLCNNSQVIIVSDQQEIHLHYSDSHYDVLDFIK